MNAVKDALLVKQHEPDIESCTILYTDIRAFGKGFDGFVARSEKEDYIKYIRGRPSKLMEIEEDNIEIFVENTEEKTQLRLNSDLVILSCAGIPSPETARLAGTLGINLNEIGFFAIESEVRPVETSKQGIYICGSAAGPQIIPDCVAQASAAASKASVFVSDHKVPEAEKLVAKVIPPDAEPRIGVFICNCGANIGRVVKTEELAAEIKNLPNVVYSGVELFACADTGQNSMKEKINEYELNRVIVAACTPRTHEPVFREACLEAGLNPYLLEMANIRDQCTWVHSKDRPKAYSKSIDLIRMAVARGAHLHPLESTEVETTKHILVIGGGISGMQAALDLDNMGFGVTLIEKSDQLGGRVKELHSVFPPIDKKVNPADELIEKINKSKIKYLLSTQVKNIEGYVGNFEITLNTEKGIQDKETLKVGAIIISIGAPLYKPDKKWRYGEISNVITSMELEKILANGDQKELLQNVKNAVFIQCVGSRGKNGDYTGCSRFCCPTTVKQAFEMKQKDIDSTVLYKDMRMVGRAAEEFYRKARNEGILFLRYDSSKSIYLKGKESIEGIIFHDTLLNKTVEVPADLVVLAIGMVNSLDHSETLRQMVKVPRGEDGFFLERHPELGPVETCIDGIFICGTIQSPKDISDSLTQASAAAEKAAELLNKDKLYIEPSVCEIDQNLCRSCGTCVDICEYHAPEYIRQDDGTEKVYINKALCKGCGTCAVWCPTNSITAKHYTDEQISSMITTLFEDYHL
jgi:heterodisulfide reductase subunit A